MTMIERMAKALYVKAQERGSKRGEQFFEDDARAAIEAMREPTEAMLAAIHPGDVHSAQCYRDMIDAALAERD